MRSRTLRAASGGGTGSSPVPSLTAPLFMASGSCRDERASPAPRFAREFDGLRRVEQEGYAKKKRADNG